MGPIGVLMRKITVWTVISIFCPPIIASAGTSTRKRFAKDDAL
jgi:hypothetical protein